MFPPVLSKADFVRRFHASEFGNRTRTWDTPGEFIAWGCRTIPDEISSSRDFPARFHLRNRVAGGETFYNLYWSECVAKWIDRPDKGTWYVGEMIDHSYQTIQGEVYRSPRGLELYYTRVQKPMRTALAEASTQVSGIIASLLLRYHLCPRSHDWLMELLDRYPDHVIEFSAFDKDVGMIPGLNAIIWEVRMY